LNISKTLKKYWDSTDKDVKNITNDLIIKWKKIAKAATKSKTPEIANELTIKPLDSISSSKGIKAESAIKIEINKVNSFFYF
jgi:hypothetical protein